jgi:hypothetical protein
MSGVSLDVAPAIDPDLSLIFQGGSNFVARIQALGAAKDAADASLAQLHLAKSAQATLDDAKALQGAAVKTNADATSTLETAKAQALVITGAAKDDAAGIIAAAQARADQIAADATSVKDAADKYAAEKRGAADLALKDAINQQKAASKAAQEALYVRATAQVTQDEAANSKAAADALAADLTARIAKLTSALNEVKGT